VFQATGSGREDVQPHVAEMASFRQFDRLKEALGGERPFLQAVLGHMGLHVLAP
jgi:hypothetical protein